MLPFPTLYLKAFGALFVLVWLVWIYFYINSVFKERDKLRISDHMKSIQIDQYQKAMAQNIKLQEAIDASIRKIRTTSNTYIQSIDSGKPPVVPAGTVVQLVAGGVLPETPIMPTFANSSTNSTQPVSEAN